MTIPKELYVVLCDYDDYDLGVVRGTYFYADIEKAKEFFAERMKNNFDAALCKYELKEVLDETR